MNDIKGIKNMYSVLTACLIIVGLVLAAIVGLAVRSMVKDKKAGKSIQCGGDCKHCGGGHCH